MTEDAHRQVEAYLKQMRAHLRRLSGRQVDEILAELRSHITERAGSAGRVEPVLAALGHPAELAKEYVTDDLLAHAGLARSPLRVIASFARWASLSVAGFFVLWGSLTGYFVGAVLILVAMLKPFHPRTAGLWVARDAAGDLSFSLHLGFGSGHGPGREVLGWWVVPIGLFVGCGLVILTTYVARWCARAYRRSRALPSRG